MTGEIERLAGDPSSPWEEEYGFSRVVRAGGFVLVGGTTAVGPGGAPVGEGFYDQADEVLRRIRYELGRAGCTLADVVQTRVYVTDISRADDVGRAHRDAFGDTRPLMTMVEVSSLIDPRLLVEIEAVALAPDLGESG